MAKKSTKALHEEHIRQVQTWLLEGYTKTDLLHLTSPWNKSERQIEYIKAEATKRIKEINLITVQENLALITKNYWELYRQARRDNNLSEATKILTHLARIKGLDQTTVNHIVEDKRPHADLSDDELNVMLESSDGQAEH